MKKYIEPAMTMMSFNNENVLTTASNAHDDVANQIGTVPSGNSLTADWNNMTTVNPTG